MPKVLTIEKCLDLLECLATREAGIGTRELSRELNMNVTTVHNIATTLLHRGYLEQDSKTKCFRIGARFFLLGQHSRLRESLANLAHPILEELSTRLNESIMLAALDRGRAISLDYIPSSHILRTEEPDVLGAQAYCTAVGKIMLSTMTPTELDNYILKNPPQTYTPHSLTDPVDIISTIGRVKAEGHSHTRDELNEGVSAVAVTICDSAGRTVAALGASAPTIRMQDAEVAKTLTALRRASKEITAAWF